MKKKPYIYLDYAAATPLDSSVARLMEKMFRTVWGNPSSSHALGREAKIILERARKKVASLLGVRATEIIFLNSGTESDNLAILGTARAYQGCGRHLITSRLEHAAVSRAFEYLEKKEKFQVTYLPVNPQGLVDLAELKGALNDQTILVSIQQASGEIGTIQSFKEIYQIIKNFRQAKFQRSNSLSFKGNSRTPFFHMDACQAAGYLDVQPMNLGADLLSFNGSKIYGPRGSAVLFKKDHLDLWPLIYGGGQEKGRRSGTEAVVLAAGLALALEQAEKRKKKEKERLSTWRDWLRDEILKIPETRLIGHPQQRLPNHLSFAFRGIESEVLAAALDRKGLLVSAGTACASLDQNSRSLAGILGLKLTKGFLRLTLGRLTTKTELRKAAQIIKKEVLRLQTF